MAVMTCAALSILSGLPPLSPGSGRCRRRVCSDASRVPVQLFHMASFFLQEDMMTLFGPPLDEAAFSYCHAAPLALRYLWMPRFSDQVAGLPVYHWHYGLAQGNRTDCWDGQECSSPRRRTKQSLRIGTAPHLPVYVVFAGFWEAGAHAPYE